MADYDWVEYYWVEYYFSFFNYLKLEILKQVFPNFEEISNLFSWIFHSVFDVKYPDYGSDLNKIKFSKWNHFTVQKFLCVIYKYLILHVYG